MSAQAPMTFAKPAPNQGSKKNLIIEGETFRWNLSKNKKVSFRLLSREQSMDR